MKTITLFEEINGYQPVDLTPATTEISTARRMRQEGKSSDSEWENFWKTLDRKNWLEKRWREQWENRRGFVILYDLLSAPEITTAESAAIKTKLTQFKEKILSYDYTFPALRIDFKKFPLDSTPQDADWEAEG